MKNEETIEYLDVNEIKPDPNQPRQTWTKEDEEEIQRMAESFKQQGVIEPIVIDENNIIILGERRWKACKIANIKVPVRRIVGLSPAKRFERQIVADTQRMNLRTTDRAWAFATAIININTGKDYSVKEIKQMPKDRTVHLLYASAKDERGKKKWPGLAEFNRRTGTPEPTVRDYLLAIELGPEFLDAVEKHGVPLTVAKEIKSLEDEGLEKKLLTTVLKEAKEEPGTPLRKETREIASFINKPKVEIPFLRQTVDVELSQEDKEALVEKKLTPSEIKYREISRALQPSPEAQERIRESMKATEEQAKKLLEIPEVKERGKWYANWLAHGALIQALGGAYCPVCEKTENLGWICHSLSLRKAYEQVTEEYQKRVK